MIYIYNFKKQFAEDVLAGIKRQTIRAPRKDKKRPQPGAHLRHYTGLRTKGCKRLIDATCTAISTIQIFEDLSEIAIVVQGRKLTFEEGVMLATADGFASRAEFIGFFQEQHGLPFEGDLIQWAPGAPDTVNKVGDGDTAPSSTGH